MQLLSEVGGLSSLVTVTVTALCKHITFVYVIKKFIQKFYCDFDGFIYDIYQYEGPETGNTINKKQTIGIKSFNNCVCNV